MTITRKKKKCVQCGREEYIWSKGRCKKCSTSVTSPKKKQVKNNDYGFSSQQDMFEYIWEISNKKCFVSGQCLKHIYKTNKHFNMFAHVLPKGKYPKWKLNPHNIVLLHPDIHYLYDQGTEKQRLESGFNFNKLYKLKEIFLSEYNIMLREL